MNASQGQLSENKNTADSLKYLISLIDPPICSQNIFTLKNLSQIQKNTNFQL